MRTLYTLLFLCVLSVPSMAQQDPLYAQYLSNPMIFNPAYAGLNNTFNASLTYRNQWAGYEGNPNTVNLNSHLSLVDNKVGVGGMIIQDNMGSAKTTEVHGLASYKLNFNEFVFSFGMQLGIVNFKNNYSQLRIDPDQVFAENLNLSKPNVGFGAILKANKFLVGLSVPRMLKSKASAQGQTFEAYNQHYYLFGSYVHHLGTRFRLKPSVLFRGVKGAPISTDLNFNISVDQKYTAGVYVRNFRSYGLLLQASFLEKFRFGYTFELPSNNSVGPQFTSHEIMLGIRMAVLNMHDRSYSEF